LAHSLLNDLDPVAVGILVWGTRGAYVSTTLHTKIINGGKKGEKTKQKLELTFANANSCMDPSWGLERAH
jgi:hypothetical protein